MKAGAVLHGYRLLDDFRIVGAGLSEWTFAERDGRTYFIKRFLAPTYPDDAAPGSVTTKTRKRARCAAFEAHHRGIQAAMAPLTSYGGNLIATLDFFRDGAKYYKVTEKVDVAGLEPVDVAALGFPTQLVLLKTVAHSLKILHDLHIVHGDLKPSNVLIKRTELGYTTKLIDFDSSYLVGQPPPPDEIVGTMNYYSPELVTYIHGTTSGTALTAASDIFALGLIYAEYLTGSLPVIDPAHREAAIAVLSGTPLHLPPGRVAAPIATLVDRMLLADPAARPTVSDVHAALMSIGTTTTTRARAPRPASAPRPTDASGTARAPGTGRPPIRLSPATTPSVYTSSDPRVAAPTSSHTPPTASTDAVPASSPTPGSILRGKGLRLTDDGKAAPPDTAGAGPTPPGAADQPPATRGRALLGKLLTKLAERRTP